MPDILTRVALGALAALLVAVVARRRRSLTVDGAVAATIVGTIVVGAGGWWWGVVLVAFFASASALSQRRRPRSGSGSFSGPASVPGPTSDPGFTSLSYETNPASATNLDPADPAAFTVRGAERDAVQVAANGGVATLIAASGFLPALTGPDHTAARFALFCGAVAAVTADTWATEIGRFSRVAPRLITTGRVVAPGVSGGLTPLGTTGSALGAAGIGALAALGAGVGWVAGAPWPLLLGTTVAGLSGSLIDSLLGATLQAAYQCPRCQQRTERRLHTCGIPTTLVRGHAWITNDVVNLAASLSGAIVGAALWLITR